MHIKQIIIKGFKTYRDEIAVGPLSPKDNIVVGLNGHGKSNFFSAIMFVLSDKFSYIRQEEKQRLIYEGQGQINTQAYVEIVLDNSDGRLPIDRPSVSLKRMLRSNKDEFFIDGKHVTKSDINSLLESGGFSRTNPYYVVQQGRVQSLAGMNEIQCLELLMEIVGTKVYDEKRKDSEKLLEDTRQKKLKIGELMERISERMSELSQESEELSQYQDLEKDKRALEYLLYKEHVVQAQGQLDEFDGAKQEIIEQLHNVQLMRGKQQEKLDKITQRLECLKFDQEQAKDSQQRQESKFQNLQITKSNILAKLSEVQEEQSFVQQQKAQIELQLQQSQVQLQSTLKSLEELMPDYQSLHDAEDEIRLEMAKYKSKLDKLYDKQGSLIKFKNIEERNQFLQSEIDSLKELMIENQQNIQNQTNLIENYKNNSQEIRQLIQQIDSTKDENIQQHQYFMQQLTQHKTNRSQLQQQILQLREEEDKLMAYQQSTISQINLARYKLQSLLPSGLAYTIEKIKLECKNIRGFHGIILDNIEINEKVITCAEVSAKLKVFGFVVENSQIAQQVLDANTRCRGGKIEIYNLQYFNSHTPKQRSYPQGQDSLPLINQISTRNTSTIDMGNLIQAVFGKFLLVRSQDIGMRYAKDYKLNCVTPDGQSTFSGGYLMGAGFHDTQKERIRCYYQYKQLIDQNIQLQLDLQEVQFQKESVQQQEQSVLKQFSDIFLQKETCQKQIIIAENQKLSLENDINSLVKSIEDVQDQIKRLHKDNQELEQSTADTLLFMQSDEIGDLSKEEINELSNLQKSIERLEQDAAQVASERLIIDNNIHELKQQSQIILPDRIVRLKTNLRKLEIQASTQSNLELQQDLQQLDIIIAQAENSLTSAQMRLQNLQQEIKQLINKEKRLQSYQSDLDENFNNLKVNAENLESKRIQITERKTDYVKKMGNLGALPSESHEKFRSESIPQLRKLLEQNSKDLSKFIHVNKRSIEQYTRFKERLEALNARLDDLKNSEDAIHNLLAHLANRKDEAIISMFRNVAHHFSEVFHELVPNGRGRLKMIKGDGEGINKYVGVNITVSFNQNEDNVLRMQALSGGQKTAVAIAIIIAIQRADPAPFYLFDELDAALDSQLRNSLANLIKRSSDKAQFIMTTFKPELCRNGSRLFEVYYQNAASNISVINAERALDVISQFTNERQSNTEENN